MWAPMGIAGAPRPSLDALARRGGSLRERHERGAADRAPRTPRSSPASLRRGHGVRENVTFLLDPRHVALATRLKRAGLSHRRVRGRLSGGGGVRLRRRVRPFQRGPSSQPWDRPGRGAAGQRGRGRLARLAGAHARGKRPFFAWVHFYDPHAPYAPPAPYRETFAGRPYDGEVAFTDGQLGSILDALRAAGTRATTRSWPSSPTTAKGWESTESRATASCSMSRRSACRSCWRDRECPEGRVIEEPVGTVDVAPTVLHSSTSRRRRICPGGIYGPRFEGKRLGAEGLYAEALFGRLNCRWSSLRAWREGDVEARRGRGAGAVRPGDRPGRDGEPRGRRAGAARAAAAGAPCGGRAHGARRRRARPVAVSTAAVGAAAQPRLHGRRRRRREPRRAGPARPAPARPGLRAARGAAERHRSRPRAGHPRDRAPSSPSDPGSPFAHFVMAAVAYAGRQARARREGFPAHARAGPRPPGDPPVLRPPCCATRAGSRSRSASSASPSSRRPQTTSSPG